MRFENKLTQRRGDAEKEAVRRWTRINADKGIRVYPRLSADTKLCASAPLRELRFLLFAACVCLFVSACGSSEKPIQRGSFSEDTIVVVPVKNLSGVKLKMPEIYLGDAVGKAAELDVEEIDIALLAEAGVYARMDELGYRARLRQDADEFYDGAKYELHTAITHCDMTEVRSTGMFTMAIMVMVIEVETQREVVRGTADDEYQLLDMAPDEVGSLGEDRFIEARMQIFTEDLARQAIADAGL